jgi:hypothetical protein
MPRSTRTPSQRVASRWLELVDHFSSVYAVLERRGWLPFFAEIELVVPMPLMRVKAPLSLVKSLRDNTISRSVFAEPYQVHGLGG